MLNHKHLLHRSYYRLKAQQTHQCWCFGDPSQIFIRLSRDKASQLLLHPLEEEVVHRSQIQPIERLLEQLNLVSRRPRLNNVGGGDPRIVPMKEPLFYEPLLISEDVALCLIWPTYGQRWYPCRWHAGLPSHWQQRWQFSWFSLARRRRWLSLVSPAFTIIITCKLRSTSRPCPHKQLW